MPYVTESFSEPVRPLKVTRGGTQYPQPLVGYWNPPALLTKTQRGWRSGDRVRESGLGIEGGKTQASRLGVLHQLESQYVKGRPFSVNDRDYAETLIIPGEVSSYARLFDTVYRRTYAVESTGSFAITAATGNPSLPSESALSSMAGQMLRRAAPSQEEIDLARSLGELKDLPLLTRAAVVTPPRAGIRAPEVRLAGKIAGQAYLSAIFGFLPTVSDVLKVCETVVFAHDIVKNYLHYTRASTRRKRERTLYSNYVTDSRPLFLSPMQQWTSGSTNYWDGLTVRFGSFLPAFTYGTSFDVHTPVLSWSLTGTQVLRVFATWEFYIPDPERVEERLSSYKAKAERLLGQGPSVAAVYDLTPWTWLVDWFVDIGGLLRYQQHVANNQLVMTRCGWSVWDRYTVNISCSEWIHDNSRGGSSPSVCLGDCRPPNATASFHRIKHTRRRGSPYSINPTWDFSPQQWAILAALGLARSTGVRF